MVKSLRVKEAPRSRDHGSLVLKELQAVAGSLILGQNAHLSVIADEAVEAGET